MGKLNIVEWLEEHSALAPYRSLSCPAALDWSLSSGSEESFLLRLPDTHGTTCSIEEVNVIDKLIKLFQQLCLYLGGILSAVVPF